MSDEPRHNIQAETACKPAIESASASRVTPEEWWKAVKSPEVQAVTAAVRKAFQELLRPLQKDSPEFRKLFQDFSAAIAAADAEIEAEFASRHLPAPKNIEDWEKLARIAGIPKDSIGGLTGREIYNQALEWAEEMQIEVERRKILAQMMAGAGVEIGAPPTPPSPSASEAKEATRSPLRSGFLGGEELADALGIPRERREAFFQQLSRERETLLKGGWIKVRKKRPNDVQYMYRIDNQRLQDLAKRYRKPKFA